MVITDISKFLHCLTERFLCPEFIQICTFVFLSVEVPFRWCVVIRISCLTHALCHMNRFTEFHKRFECILRTLATVKYPFPFDC